MATTDRSGCDDNVQVHLNQEASEESNGLGHVSRSSWPSGRRPVTPHQLTAWTLANLSYGMLDGAPLRAQAVALYQEDMRERIQELFATLDAQNVEIEAVLAAHDRE